MRVPPSPPVRLRTSERELQTAVIDLAEVLGWRVGHFHDSRRQIAPGRFVGDRQAAGGPDLTMCRRGVLILAELKAEGGRLSPAQSLWPHELQNVEAEAGGHVLVRLWCPTDMASGEIERTLVRAG